MALMAKRAIKGDKGDKGADGKNGTNGINGLNGESCDVVAVEDGFNMVCDDTVKGTVKNGSDGEDGTSCTAKDTTDTDGLKGLNVICGEKQVGTIWNGKDGSVSSLSSLSGSAVQTGNNVSGSIFDPVNNLLKDLRDGRFYKTTTIGSQIWMAEDLFANNTNLYNWTYAKARCPAGWHLPTKSEYETMVSAIGGSSVAGLKLKAAEGWGDYNGVDEYNFAAIPVGATTSVYYWTSTEGNGCSGAWAISLNTSNSSSFPCANQTYYYAVRCLKD